MSGAPEARVRDARPEDLPRLLDLLLQLSAGGEHPEMEVRALTAAHTAALCEIDADPRARLLVLEAGGGVLGSAAVYVLPNLSHAARPFAVVENVVVDASARGRGYGRLLMEAAVETARSMGCYKVSLASNRKRRPAHRFYEALGFTHTHRGYTRYFSTVDGR